MDQNGSNLIKLEFTPIKKCCYKELSHLPWQNKWSLYFWSDWIRTVHNGSNLIKLESSPIKKYVDKKSCHIHHEDKNGHFILNQIDQIGLIWIKLDQIGFLPNQKIVLTWILALFLISSRWSSYKKGRFSTVFYGLFWYFLVFFNPLNISLFLITYYF